MPERRNGAARRERADDEAPLWLYGIHTVSEALRNPRRRRRRLVATRNALARIESELLAAGPAAEIADVRAIGRLLPEGAVHQGVALLVDPLPARPVEALGDADLVVLLDQVTDPHNVGAIFRSAAAFAASAVITTSRNSPQETGALAKAASGALDIVDHVEVTNLSRTLETLGELGFLRVALDSAGTADLEAVPPAARIALVLGAEGKGVRPGVRAACDLVARLDLPGRITSLNVSNAAVLALYVTRRRVAASV